LTIRRLFQKAWVAVTNPGQEERVPQLVAAISAGFQTLRGEFDLEKVIEHISCSDRDVELASVQYLRKVLQRQWQDGVPDESKQKTLIFICKKLSIDSLQFQSIREEVGLVFFSAKLSQVLEDGIVSDEEMIELAKVTGHFGMSVPNFVAKHSRQQGVGLLRGVFAQAIVSGHLDPRVWQNLLLSAVRLGISESNLRAATLPLARTFIEHSFADAKSDGIISGEEETYIQWLFEEFSLPAEYRAQIGREIYEMKERVRIESGSLDTLSIPPGVNLNAGELLFHSSPSTARLTKQTTKGVTSTNHSGMLHFTDNRLVFDSSTKSLRISYRNIVAWQATNEYVRLTISGKPEIVFYFPPGTQLLLAEKLSALIRIHSQVLRKRIEGAVDRHIPRDVRQRVWTRYGGKCAECGNTEYLEYDHIIPVAKGGSNNEQNVQVLCRKCNLAKSDKI
jgi:hypothetical protein